MKHLAFWSVCLFSVASFAMSEGVQQSTQSQSSAGGSNSSSLFDGAVHLIAVGGVTRMYASADGNADEASHSSYGGLVDLFAWPIKLEVGGFYSSVQSGYQGKDMNFNYWTYPMYLKFTLLGSYNSGLYMKLGAVALSAEQIPSTPVLASGGFGLALRINSANSLVFDFTYSHSNGSIEAGPGEDAIGGVNALAGLSISL